MITLTDKIREALINGWYLKEVGSPHNGGVSVVTPKLEAIKEVKKITHRQLWDRREAFMRNGEVVYAVPVNVLIEELRDERPSGQ